MTHAEQLTIIILALGLIFTVLSAILGIMWRAGNKAGETLSEIKQMQQEIAGLTKSLDDHIAWHLGPNRRTR